MIAVPVSQAVIDARKNLARARAQYDRDPSHWNLCALERAESLLTKTHTEELNGLRG